MSNRWIGISISINDSVSFELDDLLPTLCFSTPPVAISSGGRSLSLHDDVFQHISGKMETSHFVHSLKGRHYKGSYFAL